MAWKKLCPKCKNWTYSLRVIIWRCRICNNKIDDEPIEMTVEGECNDRGEPVNE